MKRATKRRLLKFMSWWPPLLGAGIHVTRLDEDFLAIDVQMKLRFWNANYFGTHYGGSLYSMTDSSYALMLTENLGRGYIVWDKAATIRYRKPGRGTVRAEFRLSADEIERVRRLADTEEKVEPVYTVEVKDEAGDVVCEVEKVIYVRRKG